MAARRRARRGPATGFTLLEVLVGLVVFGLLVMTAYAGIRVGARSVAAGEARAQFSSDHRIAYDFLRRHLSRAFPMAVQRDNRWQLWFEGDPDRVVLLGDLPGYTGEGGLHELRFSVEGPDGERRIVLERRVAGSEPGDDAVEPVRRVLLAGLDSARFDYFGARARGDEPQWHETWADAQLLPSLVRLRAAGAADGPWPDLVVGLRVDEVRYQRDVRGAGDAAVHGDVPSTGGAPAPGAAPTSGDAPEPGVAPAAGEATQ